jgi:hypothetical protein
MTDDGVEIGILERMPKNCRKDAGYVRERR